MWVVWKKVGLFEHYLSPSGGFKPGLHNAQRFHSQQMAEVMARQQGGAVRSLSSETESGESGSQRP
ncbi:hypothetical protein [Lyngbya confervoides]|uniref:Uncharacterized protein n=1 Tax=Lyngbya confervoides BDU141951 TaxID=1574623 RepID=A0ABD4TCB5_9CYAN|nr:hypothetical protein [Lyngbya confervoides]MCM1985400.1 hypothetical protein [Lyngbya confervoides BDU141951]